MSAALVIATVSGLVSLASFASLGVAIARARSGASPALDHSTPTAAGPLPTPSSYAAGKYDMLSGRLTGELGNAVRAFGGTAGTFPGVPAEALVGFTAIGGADEDTCGSSTSARRTHEVGEWQTPAGPCSSPAPVAGSEYSLLAVSPMVSSMLGGPAPTGPNSWRGPAMVRARTAIGLANLRSKVDEFSRIRPSLAPAVQGSMWTVACAFGGFSTGPAGLATALEPFRAQLEATPEAERTARWFELIAERARAGSGFSGHRHTNPAYSALRVWQKLACGKLLAERAHPDNPMHPSRAWFASLPADAETERLLTMVAST